MTQGLSLHIAETVSPAALLAFLQQNYECEWVGNQIRVASREEKRAAVVNAHGHESLAIPPRKNPVEIHPASLADVDDIARIIAYWAREGENLPRDESNIVKQIQDFVVARQGDAVTGCASLMVYNRRLAEIRSLGVLPLSHGKGAGSAIVRACIERARFLQLKTVFVLTRVPEFFAKHGFVLTDKESLPEKVMKDCLFCPKQQACDEIAMILPLA